MKQQARERSKRYYQKKRERQQNDDDSDVSSVVSLPSKRRCDVSIPYEDIREAVQKVLDEKKEPPKQGAGGLAMAGAGLAGICMALYNNLPLLQNMVPKLQGFLASGPTPDGGHGVSCSSELQISLPPSASCSNFDVPMTNDCGPTGPAVSLTQEGTS